jgi:outer membrane receptor protein involved in Fe transport
MQDGFAKVNASITWTASDERFKVRLFGTNLTNKAVAVYSSTLSDGTIDVTYDAPRVFGLGLEYRY